MNIDNWHLIKPSSAL